MFLNKLIKESHSPEKLVGQLGGSKSTPMYNYKWSQTNVNTYSFYPLTISETVLT